MTNEQIIRALPIKDLASLVIRYQCEEDINYDWDESTFLWGIKTIKTTLITSDGLRFDEDDQEATILGIKYMGNENSTE